MRKIVSCALSVLALWILILNVNLSAQHADLVIKNGKVFTVADLNSFYQAVAVEGDKIIAVGSNEEINTFITSDTQVLDVGSHLVVPGFNDAHCHFASGGKSLASLNLRGAASLQRIQQIIAEKIKELPEGAPVFGTGSFPSTALFPGLGWPTKEMLDEIAPNNPVVIRRGGGHAVWVNSLALQQSGITAETEVPYGGEIVKDPQSGDPTGILKEAAQSLLKVQSQSTPKEDIARALEHVRQLGITSIQTASYLEEIEIFKELYDDGKLTVRVCAWLPISGLDYYIENNIEQNQGDEMLKTGMLKAFIDGTIGVRSALMFEDFSEEPGNSGLAQYEEEEFYKIVEKAHQHGYQVGVHAIGDKGVHWVLNAVERAQQKYGKKGLRHRVEHNTVNILEDTKRFYELGMVASMQPNITGGQAYREQRLGKERARRVDMWRTLLNNKAVLAWGTDWPVSSINPMYNLYQLVSRYEEQRLTMAEAIKYYTYGSAYASFDEGIKGTLEKGKLADIVVLSKDLFTIEPGEIQTTEVLYTILGGKIIHQSNTEE